MARKPKPESVETVKAALTEMERHEWFAIVRYFLPQLLNDQDVLCDLLDRRCERENMSLPRMLAELGLKVSFITADK